MNHDALCPIPVDQWMPGSTYCAWCTVIGKVVAREQSRPGIREAILFASRRAREDERGKLLVQIQELVETLEDVLVQATTGPGDGWNTMDSMALTAYADGIRLLADHERVKITEEHGRRVIADRGPR